jgi:hypothetical protein
MHAPSWTALLAAAVLAASCGWPSRHASLAELPTELVPMEGFEDVRAVDGYPDAAFQASFDAAIAQLAASPVPADGRRDFDMLVLSSGGVNGSFGAGILTAWSQRGDRPTFETVTGVSVGALMAPFAFAGPAFDHRLEQLFRHINPGDLHREKGVLTSVLWDESLADNRPLRQLVARGVDDELMRAIAKGHAEGRRLYVGSTNMDIGQFCIWDLGAIATRGTDEARDLLCDVLVASASIPVVYPPMRFEVGGRDELHSDGAVTRPLFMPQNVFDGYLSAERAGVSWDDIDATLYVVHNGSLRACPTDVQRDTLAIATRTVTMMSYTMVSEHILHLYLLARAWGAEFRFHTLPGGQELPIDSFTSADTNRLFLLGQGLMERNEPWLQAPPGYVVNEDLHRVQPHSTPAAVVDERGLSERLTVIEEQLRLLREELRAAREQ